MRAFLAVNIPDEARVLVSTLIEKIGGGNFKIVKPENYHLTLKFLGEKSDTEMSQIKSSLSLSSKKFHASLSGIGAFPSASRARVIWVGLGQGKEEYISLQKEVDSRLANLGIRPEREYVPHLTIARVRAVTDREKLQSFLSAEFSSGPFEIPSISMMKSELTPTGPIYPELLKIQLQ